MISFPNFFLSNMKAKKLNKVNFIAIFLFIFLPTFLFSQSNNRRIIPFNAYGKDLKHPTTGGLNAPQFSTGDLNNDGIEDLYIFDRAGFVHLTFLNEGNANASSYQFAPEYAKNFPDVDNFVKLRDFDDDGIMDLFAGSVRVGTPGMSVFKGRYENNELVFDLLKDVIEYPNTINGLPNNLNVLNIDIPEIIDVDCDGDMDILNFGTGGGYISFFKNQSIEKGFGRDSLLFTLEDNCWGGFYETGFAADILLPSEPGDCANNIIGNDEDEKGTEKHAGSTILCFDENNEGLLEVVLGDVSTQSLTRIVNAGDCSEAFMDEVDSKYPSYDVSADIITFVAAFYLDVDNDGNKDLLASPNSTNAAEDDEVVWFYKNINNNEFPTFQFQAKDFLVGEMVDFGSGTNPTFVDYNADGLMDLVVGTQGYFLPYGDRDPRLFLFENVGTLTSPSYELINDDWLNTADFFGGSTVYWAVTFGDLDGDGDDDLLLGEQEGILVYAENIAGPNNTMEFGQFQAGYMGIDVGRFSKPTIYDLNQDGLNDIIIGEKNGKLNYFQNVGTLMDPAFISDPLTAPNTDSLGLVNTTEPGFISGHSSPVFQEINGELFLFSSSHSGRIKVYNNITDNLYGTFNKIYDQYGQFKEGTNTHVTIAEIDGDGYFELIIGNLRGGLAAYNTIFEAPPTMGVNTEQVLKNPVQFNVFPNPVRDILNIELEKNSNESVNIYLYNALQQRVLHKNFTNQQIAISVKDLPSGVYFLEIQQGSATGIQKIVIR